MRDFFYGWYLKCQSDEYTLAVIPAVHGVGHRRTCSIQIITDEGVCTFDFPGDEFRHFGNNIAIGRNWFGERGIKLSICTPEATVRGKLVFGELSPLKYDIMGPFALVPFMECRHSVYSMRHTVSGTLFINEREYSFDDAWGYWEGDRGRSFPKEYAWTQCSYPQGSLMLSVADIPLSGIHFTGIIGVVIWKGQTFRLATYLGAKAAEIRDGRIRIVQGRMELEVRLLKTSKHPLKAPVKGNMARTIHESAACRAFYSFKLKGHTLFAFESDLASFEYEYSC